jgi:hypothetical protein
MSVAKELRKLAAEPLDGIKVVLNEEDVTDVTAEITGPGAPAASAIAQCLVLGACCLLVCALHPTRPVAPAFASAS